MARDPGGPFAADAALPLEPVPPGVADRLGAPAAAVARPATEEDVVRLLAACLAARRPCVPWGGGTHQTLGAAAPAGAVVCHLAALSGVSEHRAADLVVSVGAGTPLDALQAALARAGQRVPLDPPRYAPGEPTVGGLVAGRVDGPHRLGYGGWRDRVIALRVAAPKPGDDSAALVFRTGAKVVKNVAGYDVTKLHVGALGGLGVLTEVTLKVAPLPAARRTARVAAPDLSTAGRLMAALRRSHLQPAAVETLSPGLDAALWPGSPISAPAAVWVSFEDVPANVRYQVDRLWALAGEVGARLVEVAEADAAAARWEALARCWADPAWPLVVRAVGPPAAATGAFAALAGLAEARRLDVRGTAGAHGHSLAALRAPGEDPAAGLDADLVAALRRQTAAAGAALVVERAPGELRRPEVVWPQAGGELGVARRLKAVLDPAGVCNPGRLPEGL